MLIENLLARGFSFSSGFHQNIAREAGVLLSLKGDSLLVTSTDRVIVGKSLFVGG